MHMSEEMDGWRKPLKPQKVHVPRWNRPELPERYVKIKDSKFLGSGTSGTVRSLEAELVRRPRLLKDPIGWFFPKSRELKDFAIKIMRPGRVGEAMESYYDCKNAGLTVPTTYKYIELRDGRSAILMSDLRKGGYAVAQTSNPQEESTRPKDQIKFIENFESLLKTVFDEVAAASSYRNYGILLGGDSIFFLVPQIGGVGNVKHIFADFDRMHNQADYNSTTLTPLQGNPSLYKKEVLRINLETIQRKFKEFIAGFVVESMQEDYVSRIDSYVQSLKARM